jgi:hypothetical protein
VRHALAIGGYPVGCYAILRSTGQSAGIVVRYDCCCARYEVRRPDDTLVWLDQDDIAATAEVS